MAGYGIQNAVGSVIDNSVKIQRMMDLLPSEEDKALANATNAEEAAKLKAELTKGDADKAFQESQVAANNLDKIKKQQTQVKKKHTMGKLSHQEALGQIAALGDQFDEAAGTFGKAQQKFLAANQALTVSEEAHRTTVQAKIAALEKAGERKKTIFERLRGGFRDGK